MDNEITIVSIIVTIISIIISLLLAIKNYKITKELKTIKWSDLQNISDFVYKKCKKDLFIPDIIYVPSAECYHLAKYISMRFDNIIVLNGMLIKNEIIELNMLKTDNIIVEEDSWNIVIPKILLKSTDKKILIVNDWITTGNVLKRVINELTKKCISENFKLFCIVKTKYAGEMPISNFYWKEISSDDDLFLPWGKALH